jgi:hypothetical protein
MSLLWTFFLAFHFLFRIIERLDLSRNQLNGTIPVSIEVLTNLGMSTTHPVFEYFRHKCDLHCHLYNHNNSIFCDPFMLFSYLRKLQWSWILRRTSSPVLYHLRFSIWNVWVSNHDNHLFWSHNSYIRILFANSRHEYFTSASFVFWLNVCICLVYKMNRTSGFKSKYNVGRVTCGHLWIVESGWVLAYAFRPPLSIQSRILGIIVG